MLLWKCHVYFKGRKPCAAWTRPKKKPTNARKSAIFKGLTKAQFLCEKGISLFLFQLCKSTKRHIQVAGKDQFCFLAGCICTCFYLSGRVSALSKQDSVSVIWQSCVRLYVTGWNVESHKDGKYHVCTVALSVTVMVWLNKAVRNVIVSSKWQIHVAFLNWWHQ